MSRREILAATLAVAGFFAVVGWNAVISNHEQAISLASIDKRLGRIEDRLEATEKAIDWTEAIAK